MASLSEDLEVMCSGAEESFSRGEVLRGLRLTAGVATELAALLTVVIATFQLAFFFTGGLASLGLPIATGTVIKVVGRFLPHILSAYERMDTGDRKAVRAALSFLGLEPGALFDA